MDFRGFIKNWGPSATYLESYPQGKDDWRHHAITKALQESTGKWILFLEQDFIFGPQFIEKLLTENEFEVMGFKEGRYHPACLLVKKEALDRTDRNFAVTTDVSDHFGSLSKQLENVAKCGAFEDIGINQQEGQWFHYAGTTHNYYLCIKDKYENLHQPRLFAIYNSLAIKAPVLQHDSFLSLAKTIEHRLKGVNQ